MGSWKALGLLQQVREPGAACTESLAISPDETFFATGDEGARSACGSAGREAAANPDR